MKKRTEQPKQASMFAPIKHPTVVSKWDLNSEREVLILRKGGASYANLAKHFGKTESSIKHKVRRLNQDNNDDRYKHTREKAEQILRFAPSTAKNILETHGGFGGLTEFYRLIDGAFVEVYEKCKKRASYIGSLGYENVEAIHGDSEKEIKRLSYFGCVYDIVDIDPYGYPSRYMPAAFELINSGVLFLTFPVMGVAQINKIMVRHFEAFWGIELSDKDIYLEKIEGKLKDYAFMSGREITVMDIIKINRVYRFAVKVEKKSMLDIVGLNVKRRRVGGGA